MSWIYILSLLLSVKADMYIVIKINHPGAVCIRKGNREIALSEGNRVMCGDQISFTDSTDWIRLSGEKGVFTMTMDNNPCGSINWAKSLGHLLLAEMPSRTTGRILIRGGTIRNYWDAVNYFQQFEGDNHAMLIADEEKIPISREYIKDTSQSYFYLTYVTDQDTIDKKIPWKINGQELYACFDKHILPIDGECSLFLFNSESTVKRLKVATFKIKYIGKSSIRQEISLLMKGINDARYSEREKIKIIEYYINTYYGSIDEKSVTSLLKH